jgi:hypothetical protein
VIVAPTPSPGRDVFGAGYEELRRRALTGSAVAGARGLVLLLRDGLAAWMAHAPPGAPVSERAGHPDRGAAAPHGPTRSTPPWCVCWPTWPSTA